MKYILIDLDGTISNPKLGITKSIQYALKAKDIIIDELDSLCKHIGPPLHESFMSYGFDDREASELIEKYREYFKDYGIYENELYEGMEELLRKLNAAGKKLIVATSKPETYAKRIMEYFKLTDYFVDICGATFDNSRSQKKDVIDYAIKKNNLRDYQNMVMVGDRKHDIEGAKAVGISSVGVLYGFGSREELQLAGADKIVGTLEELYDYLVE